MNTEAKLKKELKALSDAVLLHIHYLDTKIGKDKSISDEVGSLLAKLTNHLDFANDTARHNALGVGITGAAKAKAVQRLLAKVQ